MNRSSSLLTIYAPGVVGAGKRMALRVRGCGGERFVAVSGARFSGNDRQHAAIRQLRRALPGGRTGLHKCVTQHARWPTASLLAAACFLRKPPRIGETGTHAAPLRLLAPRLLRSNVEYTTADQLVKDVLDLRWLGQGKYRIGCWRRSNKRKRLQRFCVIYGDRCGSEVVRQR